MTWLIYEVEGFFFLCSENKGADQMRDSVFGFAYARCRFSHDVAHNKHCL